MSDPAPYQEVRDLTVRFRTDDGIVRAVNGVAFTAEPGRDIVGLDDGEVRELRGRKMASEERT